MTSIRNLPIAARLGGAFGVLCLALAIVAFAGMTALSSLQAKSENLGEHQLVAAELLGGMQQRAKDNVGLIGLHLYVTDGDLAAQDEHFKEIEANWAQSKADGAKLEQLFKGSAVEEKYAAWVATRAEMLEAAEADARSLAQRDGDERRGPQRVPDALRAPVAPAGRRDGGRGRPAHRRHARQRRDRRQGSERHARQRRAPDAHRRRSSRS